MNFVEGAGALADVARGRIGREIFASDDIYRQEQKQIFARAWLYIGHESQIRKAGQFALSKMGETSVILTRDRGGKIRVLHNSCRHRGMRVCRYDEGKTDRFYCPYHGWSYGLDGKLKHVTSRGTDYDDTFDVKDWGLREARSATYRETVWATWDESAPSLEDYLGESRMMLDQSFTAWDGEGEVEMLGGIQKWIIPSNWKIVVENFAGDGLHTVSHHSADTVGLSPNGEKGRRDGYGDIIKVVYPNGHGGTYFDFTGLRRDEYLLSPETVEYFQTTLKRRREVMGDKADLTFGVGTYFPNMSFHGNQPRTILVAHPLSPDRTEIWRSYFVDKDAPPAVRTFLRNYYMRYSGPGGLVESDDIENWGQATRESTGLLAPTMPYNYMAGMHEPRTLDRIPGATRAPTTGSEITARSLYSFWGRMMDAASWEDVARGEAYSTAIMK